MTAMNSSPRALSDNDPFSCDEPTNGGTSDTKSLLVEWDGNGSDEGEEYSVSSSCVDDMTALKEKYTPDTPTNEAKDEKHQSQPRRIRRWGLKRIEKKEESSDESCEDDHLINTTHCPDNREDRTSNARADACVSNGEEDEAEDLFNLEGSTESQEMDKMIKSSSEEGKKSNPLPPRKNVGVKFLAKFKKTEEEDAVDTSLLDQDEDHDPLTKKRHGDTGDKSETDRSNPETLPQSIQTSGRSFDLSPPSPKDEGPSRKMEGFGGGEQPDGAEDQNGGGLMGVFHAFQKRRLRSKVEFDAAGLTVEEVDKLKEEVSNAVSKDAMESMFVEHDPVDKAAGTKNWKDIFQIFSKAAFAPDEFVDRALDPEDGEGNLGFYGQVPLGDADDLADDYNLEDKRMRKMKMEGDAPDFDDKVQVFINEVAVIDPYYSDDEPGGRYRRIIVGRSDRDSDDEKDNNEKLNGTGAARLADDTGDAAVDDTGDLADDFNRDIKNMRKMRIRGDAPGLRDIAQALMDDIAFIDDAYPYYSDEESGGRYKTIIGKGSDSDTDDGKDDLGTHIKEDSVAGLICVNKELQGKVESLERDLRKSNEEKEALKEKVHELEQKLGRIVNSNSLADEVSDEDDLDEIRNRNRVDSDEDEGRSNHDLENHQVGSTLDRVGMHKEPCETDDDDLIHLEADLLNLESDLLDLEYDIKKDNNIIAQIEPAHASNNSLDV